MSTRERTIADKVLVAIRKRGAILSTDELRIRLKDAEARGLSTPDDVIQHVLDGVETRPPQRQRLRAISKPH